MSGRVIIIAPDGSRKTWPWEGKGPPDLTTLQQAVGGGYIEHVRVRFEGRTRDAYVDEDGLAKGLRVNREGTALTKGTRFEGSTFLGPLAIWVPDPKVKTKQLASLIAAAPDLLAALQAVKASWHSKDGETEKRVWAQMRAALAKAGVP